MWAPTPASVYPDGKAGCVKLVSNLPSNASFSTYHHESDALGLGLITWHGGCNKAHATRQLGLMGSSGQRTQGGGVGNAVHCKSGSK